MWCVVVVVTNVIIACDNAMRGERFICRTIIYYDMRNIRSVYMTCILLSVTMIVWHTSSTPRKTTTSSQRRHMEDVLVGVQEYGHGIRLGTWNQSLVTSNTQLPYNEQWAALLRMLDMPPGCNAVDIGANDGVYVW